MEIKISTEELRKRPLMVGTPMYGGQCSSPYHISSIDLTNKFIQLGIPLKHCVIENESLITRARNNIMHMFMHQTDFNRLLFIDADIKFSPDDVLSLLAFSDQYPVICGSYPKKAINWPIIERAVRAGVPTHELKNFIDNPVLNFVPSESGVRKMDLSAPVEVLDTGTGFMMIRKDVPEIMAQHYPELKYTPDYALHNPGFDDSRDKGVFAFFDTRIFTDETSIAKKQAGVKRYLSEDYSFCQLWRAIGGKIFVCPWINLVHHGTYQFQGNIQPVMALQSKEFQELQEKNDPKSGEKKSDPEPEEKLEPMKSDLVTE